MIAVRFPLPAVVLAVLLAPALRAEDKAAPALARAELDRRIVRTVTETVGLGADLYNGGNPEGCYRLYQGALKMVAPLLDHRPALKGLVEEKLRKAEGLPRPADRAFALREALDEIYTVLRKGDVPTAAPAKSLYERLGGEAAVKAVVDDFVARAAADPKVNFTRKGTAAEWQATPENVAHLKKGLVQLIGAVTGGPQKYEGRSMKDTHRGMRISDAEFNALAADLKATLDKFKVPEKEQGELFRIIESTRKDIVEKPAK